MLSSLSSSPFLRSPPSSSSVNLSPPSIRFRPAACPYEVLGISTAASGDEIKAAYRRLARTCHPDVAEGSQADEFVKINAAYSVLSDREKRMDYDRRVSRRTPVYTCRNWETDQCW